MPFVVAQFEKAIVLEFSQDWIQSNLHALEWIVLRGYQPQVTFPMWSNVIKATCEWCTRKQSNFEMNSLWILILNKFIFTCEYDFFKTRYLWLFRIDLFGAQVWESKQISDFKNIVIDSQQFLNTNNVNIISAILLLGKSCKLSEPLSLKP